MSAILKWMLIFTTYLLEVRADDYANIFPKAQEQELSCNLQNGHFLTLNYDPGYMLNIICTKSFLRISSVYDDVGPDSSHKIVNTHKLKNKSLQEILSTRNRTFVQKVILTNIDIEKPYMSGLTTFSELYLRYTNYSNNVFSDFKNLTLLSIESTKLNLRKNEFKNLQSLERLIIKCTNSIIQNDVLVSLTSLNELEYMRNSKIPQKLPEKLLNNLGQLKEVEITMCALEELPLDLFYNSINIQHLNFSGNKIKDLPHQLFKELSQVETLDLSNNAITNLTHSTLSSMKTLKKLNVNYNKIKHISSSFFSTLTGLKHLSMAHNMVANFGNTAVFKNNYNLVYIDMAYNFLDIDHRLTYSFPDDVQYLNLSNNNVTEMCPEWINSSPNLKELNLHHNHINSLKLTKLDAVSSSLRIDLTKNIIAKVDFLLNPDSEIPPFTTHHNAIKVKIDDNPFDCSCPMFYLIKHVEEKASRVQIDTGNATCALPLFMEGNYLNRLNTTMFSCLLEEHCPRNCTCFIRMSDGTPIVNCTNYTQMPLLPDFPLINAKGTTVRLNRDAELYLQNNALTKITIPQNVSKLFLGGNRIITVEAEEIGDRMKILDLSNNKIEKISGVVMKSILTSGLEKMHLSGNPIACDCENWDFIHSLQSYPSVIADYELLQCPNKKKISAVNKSYLCNNTTTYVVVGFSILVLLCVLGITKIIFMKYSYNIILYLYKKDLLKYLKWFVIENDLDCDRKYDAFVSYANEDLDFVQDELLRNLESEPNPLKLCLHYRDWIVGKEIALQITDSVRNSRKTIIVLTQNFLQSHWGLKEFWAAYEEALREQRSRVIVIIKGDIDVENLNAELKNYINTTTYIKWGDTKFWERLREVLHFNGYHYRDIRPYFSARSRNPLIK